MTKTPINILIDRAGMQCVVCSATMETWNCWTKCKSGWSYRTGESCRSPVHVCEEVGSDVAATVLEKLSGLRMSAKFRSAVERATYEAAYSWADEFMKHKPKASRPHRAKGEG